MRRLPCEANSGAERTGGMDIASASHLYRLTLRDGGIPPRKGSGDLPDLTFCFA